MTKNLLVAAFIFACHISVFGQKISDGNIVMDSWQIQTGVNIVQVNKFSAEQLRKTMPNSLLLKQEFEQFIDSDYYNDYRAYFGMSWSTDLRFSEKSKVPLLRVGLNYARTSFLRNNILNTEVARFDTLVSNLNGGYHFVDTVHERQLQVEQYSNLFQVDLAAIWRSNQEARWSTYGGVGVSLGVASDNRYTIRYSDRTYIKGDYMPYAQETADMELVGEARSDVEQGKLNVFFSTTASFPMGIDFAVGKEKSFWQNFHVFYEVKPQIIMGAVPGVTWSKAASLYQGIGIRISKQN